MFTCLLALPEPVDDDVAAAAPDADDVAALLLDPHPATIAAADSIMVERLRAAGVIFIGKTNTPEFGFGSHSYNPVYGVTRNPYDLARSALAST